MQHNYPLPPDAPEIWTKAQAVFARSICAYSKSDGFCKPENSPHCTCWLIGRVLLNDLRYHKIELSEKDSQ